MKKKFLSLMLALLMLVTPSLAQEQPISETQPQSLPAFHQKRLINTYAHLLADNYYYGATDQNILYHVICDTIDNGGVFDIERAISVMVNSLGDEYAEYYSPEQYAQTTGYFEASFFGIGVTLTVSGGGTVVENVFTGSSAEMAGIQAGDRIIGVNGVDTSKFEPAATRELIVGEEGTFVDIALLRGSERINVRAVRQTVNVSHSSLTFLENGIAYIGVESFTSSLPDEFDKYIEELKEKNINKVIIDLRDNGGGDLDAAIKVAQKLIPAGIIGKLKYRNEEDNIDLYSENLSAPQYKMLVLVNENTASASEFLAMALQCRGKAKILGTNTYGKGCMQAVLQTPTGSGFKFTIGEYFTPDDKRVHKSGITPDIEVDNIIEPVDVESFKKLNLTELDDSDTMLGIEQRLNALRLIPDLEVDGVYNSYTEAAVRVYQQYSQLEVTGEIDFYTALSINDYEYTMNKVIDIQMEKALEYLK